MRIQVLQPEDRYWVREWLYDTEHGPTYLTIDEDAEGWFAQLGDNLQIAGASPADLLQKIAEALKES